MAGLLIAGGSSPTATLDITDNNIIVRDGDLAALTEQVKSGLNVSGSLWTGLGITSSTAANDSSGVSAVGIDLNDDGAGGTLYENWPFGADSGGAVPVSHTDVLIKYTYYGDADLDGVVDISIDYSLWETGFTAGGSLNGWFFGDFDYDGVVNSSTDYDLWSAGHAGQGSGPLSVYVQPVPEPSTLALAILGLAGMAAIVRRRRSQSSAAI